MYLVKRNGEYIVVDGQIQNDKLADWPSDVPGGAVKYIDDSLDIDAAHALWLQNEVSKKQAEDKAALIKDEYDKADMLIGQEAVKCFNTTNVDAMNADKDTIQEILKGNGYLVGAGFKARRDIISESIVKGQVLNTQADLERYAAAQWQNILAYGQKRVELMAIRDDAVEAIEAL